MQATGQDAIRAALRDSGTNHQHPGGLWAEPFATVSKENKKTSHVNAPRTECKITDAIGTTHAHQTRN